MKDALQLVSFLALIAVAVAALAGTMMGGAIRSPQEIHVTASAPCATSAPHDAGSLFTTSPGTVVSGAIMLNNGSTGARRTIDKCGNWCDGTMCTTGACLNWTWP